MARGVEWETFEEQAKVALVENPLGTRFTLKTSKRDPKQTEVVARVTTHRGRSQEQERVTHQTITYRSTDATSLARLVRVLRFGMQEVLGPMKLATTPALLAAVAPTAEAAGNKAKAKAKGKPKQKKKKKSSQK